MLPPSMLTDVAVIAPPKIVPPSSVSDPKLTGSPPRSSCVSPLTVTLAPVGMSASLMFPPLKNPQLVPLLSLTTTCCMPSHPVCANPGSFPVGSLTSTLLKPAPGKIVTSVGGTLTTNVLPPEPPTRVQGPLATSVSLPTPPLTVDAGFGPLWIVSS